MMIGVPKLRVKAAVVGALYVAIDSLTGPAGGNQGAG